MGRRTWSWGGFSGFLMVIDECDLHIVYWLVLHWPKQFVGITKLTERPPKQSVKWPVHPLRTPLLTRVPSSAVESQIYLLRVNRPYGPAARNFRYVFQLNTVVNCRLISHVAKVAEKVLTLFTLADMRGRVFKCSMRSGKTRRGATVKG